MSVICVPEGNRSLASGILVSSYYVRGQCSKASCSSHMRIFLLFRADKVSISIRKYTGA